MFKALLIEKNETDYRCSLQDLDDSRLPEGDVTVAIDYSSLNYKDALAITGAGPIAKVLPLVPGIDFAGVVSASTHSDYPVGTAVILNGWGVGESHWGGLAQKARVKVEWLTPLPAGLSTRQAMSLGTAGYTAMLCIMALEKYGVLPGQGEILVTGATGGVGSIAVALLHRLGYQVVAMTGKLQETAYLKALGADSVIDRQSYSKPSKPLQKERWAGVVDTVGSHILANACAAARQNGVVAACGLAGGMDFPTTVAPFILRGVTLAGINCVVCDQKTRSEAWARLAQTFPLPLLDSMTREIPLSQVLNVAPQFMNGTIKGRVLVNVQD